MRERGRGHPEGQGRGIEQGSEMLCRCPTALVWPISDKNLKKARNAWSGEEQGRTHAVPELLHEDWHAGGRQLARERVEEHAYIDE